MSSNFRYLGQKTAAPTKELDVFPSPGIWEVEFYSQELTAFCPVTHQPDFYEVRITYCPLEFCVESKSLKLYLQSFREDEAFAEALAEEIADDLFAAVNPAWLRVILAQQVRGGLSLTAEARRGSREDWS
jgi:7-cyano-7-deazaguanine reductase